MKHPLLKAEKRVVLGKKVKKLRREGLLPANVYGKHLSSTAIQVKVADFEKIHKAVGETGLIDLEFDGNAKPVLIKNLQMNFQSHIPLHADFYQVNLKEKVKTMVPVVLIGEAKAVTDKAGMLLQTLSDVEIEALPEKLPDNLEVSVEHLAAVGESLTVADLTVPEGVTVLTDSGQAIAQIAELTVAEAEPEVEPEASEGEAKKEDGSSSDKQAASVRQPADSGEPKKE